MITSGVEVIRNPNVFYRDTALWIPLNHPIADKVRRKTTLLIPSKTGDGISYFYLWKEEGNHLVVPRNFPLEKVLDTTPGLPKIDIVEFVGEFKHINFQDNITLDYKGTTHQTPALNKWISSPSGVLNLACGKGKTVVALKAIAKRSVPALVIVHTTSLLQQWKDQVKKFLPEARLGIIQGPPTSWSWKNTDITIAMIQTLVEQKYNLTPELRGYFGTIVWDEVHHLGAETFSQTANLFIGNRYGLSATVERPDGMDIIYNYHLGKVFFSDLSQELIPRVYAISTNIRVDLNDTQVRLQMSDKMGQWNIPKARNFVATLPDRIAWEVSLYRYLRRHKRTVLVLSHSVQHLSRLSDLMEQTGLCTGSVRDIDLRTSALLNHDIVFATTQLAREGLDRPDFDTLVLSTPFGSGISGANNFQQAVGRILRPMEGKDPVVIILDDVYIPPLHKMVRGILSMLRRWPKQLGGPLSYDYISNYNDLSFG